MKIWLNIPTCKPFKLCNNFHKSGCRDVCDICRFFKGKIPEKKITHWEKKLFNCHFSQKLLKFLQDIWCIRFLNTQSNPSKFHGTFKLRWAVYGCYILVTTLWGFQVIKSVTSMSVISWPWYMFLVGCIKIRHLSKSVYCSKGGIRLMGFLCVYHMRKIGNMCGFMVHQYQSDTLTIFEDSQLSCLRTGSLRQYGRVATLLHCWNIDYQIWSSVEKELSDVIISFRSISTSLLFDLFSCPTKETP